MKYFLLIMLLLLTSCRQDVVTIPDSLTVITYNLYNMFDSSDDGTEYAQYRPQSGYTARDAQKRCELYSALLRRRDFDADVMIFQEVESEKVLEAILDSGMRRRGYLYYGIVRTDSPISVGFISKIKPTEVNIHDSGDGRAFLSLEVMKDGRQYLIIGLHAKSNLGSDEENVTLRRQLARHVRELAGERENCIVAGDFNSVIRKGDMLSPVDDGASLHVVTDMDGVRGGAFYDATEDLYFPLSAEGTYRYQGEWYFYDKILVSETIVREASSLSLEVMNVDSVSGEDGAPIPYDNSSESGYSDHFAVKLTLEY